MEWRTSLEKAMSVQITPKSTQHTGMAISTEGSVAAWQVTFQLDGDDAAISVSVAGPFTHQEAQQKAQKKSASPHPRVHPVIVGWSTANRPLIAQAHQ
jgi:hypothetical protein